MRHEMKLHKRPFEMIESGAKRYELRLFDEKRQRISVGDTIVFRMSDDSQRILLVTVTGLHCFPDFASLYEALPLSECGYCEKELSTASPHDMEAYYSPEEQALYGVVAIEVKVI